jgi:hypothetical protein
MKNRDRLFPKCFSPSLIIAVETDFMYPAIFREQNSIALALRPKADYRDLETLKRRVASILDEHDRAKTPARKKSTRPQRRGSEISKIETTDDYFVLILGDRKSLPWDKIPWDDLAEAVELCIAPDAGTGAKGNGRLFHVHSAATGNDPSLRPDDELSQTEILIGVIDDGCAFANWRFRGDSDIKKLRTLGILDMNPRPPIPVPSPGKVRFGRPYGSHPGQFKLIEFPRATTSTTLGLVDWCKLHSANGTVDEDSCYLDGGFIRRPDRSVGMTRMGTLVSHGSLVMDLAAGQRPLSARLDVDGESPPVLKPETDRAAESDIVFVQLPEVALENATGEWLEYVIPEAIDYILSFVGPRTKQVVVSLSYGPTTGRHDGTSDLEKSFQRRCDFYNGTDGQPRLDIVLPAGNSCLTGNHVTFVSDGTPRAWSWQIPPDNPVECFAEIFLPRTAKVLLKSPHGESITGLQVQKSGDRRTLFIPGTKPSVLEPEPAPHGTWTIEVSGVPVGHQIHAYLSRTNANLGMRTGAKASYFFDPVWEQTEASGAAHRLSDGVFDDTGSRVSRTGTLNGIATGKHGQIHVAGGYVLRRGRKASYSSRGPARLPSPRLGPDWALPTDEAPAHLGVRGAGTRGGATFRLIGTSSAVPQLARHIANGYIVNATQPPGVVPQPPGGPDPTGHGYGNLPPP